MIKKRYPFEKSAVRVGKDQLESSWSIQTALMLRERVRLSGLVPHLTGQDTTCLIMLVRLG